MLKYTVTRNKCPDLYCQFLYYLERINDEVTLFFTWLMQIIIIIIIIYESCSAKSTNENDGALHSHKTLS